MYEEAAYHDANDDYDEEEEDVEEWDGSQQRYVRKGNNLPFWGNQNTMNLNPLILTNIQNSPYFKGKLDEVKTYHEVIDEIYYKVSHLEPWERGSRKTAGQTGMCGGVRGVGAGGIVSSAFCLLYKLSMIKLTRKQLNGILNHADSPYIRGLGFMYIRFTQPPQDLLEWYEGYFYDEEVIDVKAGGGKEMTIGEMLRAFLVKLEWFDTRFPRIPVHVQKGIDDRLQEFGGEGRRADRAMEGHGDRDRDRDRNRDRPRDRERNRDLDRERRQHNAERERRDRDAERERGRKERERERERDRPKRKEEEEDGEEEEEEEDSDEDVDMSKYDLTAPAAENDKETKKDSSSDKKHDRDRERNRDRDRDRHRDRDRDRDRRRDHDKHRDRERDRDRDRDRDRKRHKDDTDELKRYKEDRKKHKKHKRSRSRSRDRDRDRDRRR